MTSKTIALFTSSYPFGTGEEFLETEISYISKKFERVNIVPFEFGESNIKRKTPSNVTIARPLLPNGKVKKILKGIFNLSPINFSFEELAIAGPKHLRKWLSATLQIRAILSSTIIKKELFKYHPSLIYFYWGFPTTATSKWMKRLSCPTIARFHRGDIYIEEAGGYIAYRKIILDSIDEAIFISKDGLEVESLKMCNGFRLKPRMMLQETLSWLFPIMRDNIVMICRLGKK